MFSSYANRLNGRVAPDAALRSPARWATQSAGPLALVVLATACTDDRAGPPPPIAPEVLATEHEEWRERRRNGLANPNGGVVSWAGLWELREGANRFGADPDLVIVLPAEDSPPFAGTFYLETASASAPGSGEQSAARIRLVPEQGAGIGLREAGAVEEPIAIAHDRAENTTYLTLGSLGLRVHAERGTDRLWLRAWDTDSPRAAAFDLPPYFPVTNEWRLAARFDPYPEPLLVPMADVTGGTVAHVSPGQLVFRAEGREHRLIAFATESSRDYLVMLRDSTAFTGTYQLGRYMHVPFPDDDGWTVIDFNRAYSPPCAFTPHSVCSFPPRENRLTLAVRAGEKRPEEPGYGLPGSLEPPQ